MDDLFRVVGLEGYSPLEIELKTPDDFLKIRETLARIGVASKKEKTLWQSCHILHKRNRYYIVHFKELFALDGKFSDISENDIQRRNTIAKLLQDWELLKILDEEKFIYDLAPLSQIKILSYREKSEWNIETKYNLGKKPTSGQKSTKVFLRD